MVCDHDFHAARSIWKCSKVTTSQNRFLFLWQRTPFSLEIWSVLKNCCIDLLKLYVFSDNRFRKFHVWCLNQVLKFRCWSWGSELRTSRSPWCRWAVTLFFCEFTFNIQLFYLSKGWSSRWNILWASTGMISTIFGKSRFFRAQIHLSKFRRIQKF